MSEKQLSAGGNLALPAGQVRVRVRWSPGSIAGHEVDASAFVLAGESVRSDADFVFYNQPSACGGAVTLEPGAGESVFVVDPARLPADVDRIAIAITIHGAATFAQASSVELAVPGVVAYAPELQGRSEAALVLGEVYRRNDQWKLRAVGQGFAGGLGPLARRFGVDVADEPPEEPPSAPPSASPAPPAASPSRLNLDKKLLKLEKSAPKLISLAKTARLSLEKTGLDAHVAAVALVLDVSYSMTRLFEDGTVQAVVERVLGLGLNFDDNGAIDVFAFQSKAFDLGELKPERFASASQWIRASVEMGGTRYAPAVAEVLKHYGFSGGGGFFSFGRKKAGPQLPVYVLFVTDGDCSDHRDAEAAIKEASRHPVFFQFVGIGGSSFKFLEKLDDLPGRELDNANFFAVRDPKGMPEAQLYDRMMEEYPGWVREAKGRGLIG